MMKIEPSGIKQERSSVFVVVTVLDGGRVYKRPHVNIGEITARAGMPLSERNWCGNFAIAWKEVWVGNSRAIVIQL